MPLEQRRLLIDVAAALTVRVRVGPIGWVVLEAIASFAPPDRGVVEVVCSARSLSDVVGVSKDTVARTLRTLSDSGLVARVEHRDELSGRFLSTTYRVDLSAVGLSVVVAQVAVPVPSTSGSPRPPARNLVAQLSLLS
jgi:DNA-binding transcriptional ArsR family regulator